MKNVLIALLVLSLACNVLADNTIVNGGFENDFTGWDNLSMYSDGLYITVDPSLVFAGTKSAMLFNNTHTCQTTYFYQVQDINTSNNRLRFWYRNNRSSSLCTYKFTVSDSNPTWLYYYESSNTSDEYREVVIDLPNKTSNYLTFMFEYGAYDFLFIDNVSLESNVTATTTSTTTTTSSTSTTTTNKFYVHVNAVCNDSDTLWSSDAAAIEVLFCYDDITLGWVCAANTTNEFGLATRYNLRDPGLVDFFRVECNPDHYTDIYGYVYDAAYGSNDTAYSYYNESGIIELNIYCLLGTTTTSTTTTTGGGTTTTSGGGTTTTAGGTTTTSGPTTTTIPGTTSTSWPIHPPITYSGEVFFDCHNVTGMLQTGDIAHACLCPFTMALGPTWFFGLTLILIVGVAYATTRTWVSSLILSLLWTSIFVIYLPQPTLTILAIGAGVSVGCLLMNAYTERVK